MILEISSSLLLILLAYLIKALYVSPKKTMERYAEFLKAKGYKVRFFPYSLLRNQYYYLKNKNSKGEDNGDPMKNIKEEYPHHDVVITNMLNKPIIQLCCPELIKEFYAVDKHYSYPKQSKPVEAYKRIIGVGIIFSEGNQWKRKRTIFNNVFNFDFLKSQTKNIADISEKCLRLAEKDHTVVDQQSNHSYIETDTLDVLLAISSQVMLKIFLGINNDEKIEGQSIGKFIKQLLDDATISGFKLASLIFGEKLMNLGLRSMDRSIKRRVLLYKNWAIPYIRNKIRSIQTSLQSNPNKNQPSDIIEALIMEKFKSKNESITEEQEILSEFSTFFFAGTETTSNYLQMMINQIAKHPEVEHKLREEISKYMTNEDYSYENLKKLKYIDCIQKQIIRLYGPVISIFWRNAKQDNFLGQIPVKKGTIISITNYGNHYSQKYFSRPCEFRPERWEEQCKDLPPFVLGGFSFGARMCIGKHLAMIESKIAVIKFMKRYKKILLPNNNWKLLGKFVLCSETVKTKLIINE